MTMRRPWFLVAALAILAAGCADQTASTVGAHPPQWGASHRAEAKGSATACTACHGTDLGGGSVGVSCFQCHSEGPPFRIHPASWADPREDHRGFPLTLSWTLCANAVCHGSDLKGGSVAGTRTGPSCSSASFTHEDGQSSACHAGGPPAPHPLPFEAPTLHGPQARDKQVFCRNCHGRPANRFEGGFVAKGNCSSAACHPTALAHPTDWQGRDDRDLTYPATHWTINATAIAASCSLCHNATAAAPGPMAGAPSCFAAEFTNPNGSSGECHALGPSVAPHALPFTAPAQHGPEARDRLDSCQACHGTVGTTRFDGNPGVTQTACSQTACHPAAGAHPTRWQGSNDLDPAFAASHRAVSLTAAATACAICHDVTQGRAAPQPSAPSCFARSHTNAEGSITGCHAAGPGTTPHAVPYTRPDLHGPQAKAGLGFCQTCHGKPATTEFSGGTAFTECSTCHTGAGAHPTNWQGNDDDASTNGYYSSHRDVGLGTLLTSCALCHNTAAAGDGPRPGAPSCFSASFTNGEGNTSGCHPGGPGTAPHAAPFTAPADHGPVAKQDLAFCQTCHGRPGDILFTGGIVGVACSVCHPDAGAHPTNWQGTNDGTDTNGYLSSHRSAGQLGTACALCHNTEAAAAGPNPKAPSCFSAQFTNGAGNTTPCHPSGPGAPHARPFTVPADHGPVAKQDLGFCQECHGTPGTTAFDGRIATTACSQAACHPSAQAHPTNWQGTNDDATTNGYFSSHRTSENQGTACVICHDGPTQGGVTKLPGAPSCFAASHTNANQILTGCHATGPGAPHLLPFARVGPADTVSVALHGSEARGNLAVCQQCHAAPFNGGPGSNPRFDVLLGRLDDGAGRTGCELCHRTGTAHPVPWAQGVVANHKLFGNKQVVCALCHGANLQGPADTPAGVGPACTTCHKAGLPIQVAGGPVPLESCTSCHNFPPNGLAPAGNARPNREGAHTEHTALPGVTPLAGQVLTCTVTCHNGAGSGTANHFDLSEPANVSISSLYDAKSGAAVRNPDGTCSNVSCHGGIPTPPWSTGGIDRSVECGKCHAFDSTKTPVDAQFQTPQFNGPYSPRHFSAGHKFGMVVYGGDNIDLTKGCRLCHDPAKLEPAAERHFSGLATPGTAGSPFETAPGSTLRAELQFASGSCTPNAAALGPGLFCHGQRTW